MLKYMNNINTRFKGDISDDFDLDTLRVILLSDLQKVSVIINKKINFILYINIALLAYLHALCRHINLYKSI